MCYVSRPALPKRKAKKKFHTLARSNAPLATTNLLYLTYCHFISLVQYLPAPGDDNDDDEPLP